MLHEKINSDKLMYQREKIYERLNYNEISLYNFQKNI